MPVMFTFNKSSESLPPHGSEIVYIAVHDFYGSYEFKFGEVEWQWLELDGEGHWTGTSFLYEEGEDQPPNTRCVAIVNHASFEEGEILWAFASTIDKVLEDCGA
jgi:hypothetical protein